MRRFLLKLLRRKRLDRDLEAELAFHREMAARHENSLSLGNTTLIKEQALDLWRFNFLENLWRDVVYATRSLRRSPGFVLSALLSLGLGIGANTAMFSLAVEMLMSEPSVTDAGSIALINFGGNSHTSPAVIEFVRRSGVFADVAGQNEETYINWDDGSETRRVFAVQATKNYFTALGIPVAHGRGWTASDPDQVAVLRYQFWQKHYNSDPSVIGRAIRLDGRAYTVVGILTESHRTLIGYGFSPDIYVPRYIEDTVLAVYAKLKPEMSFAQARAAAESIGQQLDRELPARWKHAKDVKVAPVAGLARFRQGKQFFSVGLFFLALLIIVGLVLLIACVNVAGLLLAQSAARRQEIAIRLSLGASRGRLLQQLLAESLLLSVLGTILGFFIALLAARSLAAIPLPVPVPIQLHIDPDWRVAVYAAMLAIVSTVATGLVPAWQSVKLSLASDLQREQKLRARRTLVVVQIAVCFVVLATGALFLQNLFRSTALGPGFDIRRTLRAEVHLPPSNYRDESRINPYVDRALSELRAIPGIEAVAAARIVPFTDATTFGTDITFTGSSEKRQAHFNWNAVSPDYFRVMDIPVLAGRTFADSDRSGERVVIVNSEFAKRYLGDRSPVGVTFLWGDGQAPHRIVGVVRGTKNLTIGEDARAQLYQPLAQIKNERPRIQFVLRSTPPPATQLAAARQVLRQIEPGAGLEVATLYSSIGLAFLPSQVGAVLMGGIGLLGLLLAAIGLYGVLAYSVSRRTREFGIRMAMGAPQADIARMILMESAKLLAVGIAVGLIVGVFVMRPLSIFLVPGLTATDPLSFVSVVFVLAATGMIGTLGPVRRATSIDPACSLKYE